MKLLIDKHPDILVTFIHGHGYIEKYNYFINFDISTRFLNGNLYLII